MEGNLFSRRTFLDKTGKAVLAGTASMALPRFNAPSADPQSKRPNIVIILADDLGYGDLACYGHKVHKTPNIDALAKGGVRFTDFHSSGAVCSPTRAGLLTGRYQQRAGIHNVLTAADDRKKGLSTDETTFATLLKKAGYSTALFGKWHLGYDPQFNPTKHGFDRFRGFVSGNIDYVSHADQTYRPDWWDGAELKPEKGYTTHLITKHSVDFIEENKDKPFCLVVSHAAVHYPYQKPGDELIRWPGEKTEKVKGDRPNVAQTYAAMLAEMDKGVGEIVETLKRLGLEKDTFVFFASDNGGTGPGSNGNLRGAKATLWEGGHRVPAIACWPGRIAEGGTANDTAICMDLFPTVLAVAGVDAPESRPLDGASLAPLLTERKPLGERALFWAHVNQRAVRQGPWKLVVPVSTQKDRAEFFDLSKDPGEKEDLAAKEPERVKAMLKALEDWEKEVGANVEPDQKLKEQRKIYKPG